MTPSVALLMAGRPGGSSGVVFLVEMVLIFAIFYFLLIRPQTKERERHQKMLAALKKGDEIITNGGVIGRVVHVEENRLTVRTAENTRLTVDRGRVAQVVEEKGGKAEE
jgi:preprotein translocase subunit YajC